MKRLAIIGAGVAVAAIAGYGTFARSASPYVHHVRAAAMACREANINQWFPNQQAPELLGYSASNSLHRCELAVGPGELPSSNFDHVELSVRDMHQTYNFVAYICFETLGTGAITCGEHVFSTGFGLNNQWLTAYPPAVPPGDDVVAFINMIIPQGGGNVFRGYVVYGN